MKIIRNKLTVIFFLLLISCAANTQVESIIDFQISNATILINTTKGKYEIQYFSKNVVQTAFLYSDEDDIGDSHGIIGHEASFGLNVDQIQIGVYGFYPDINKKNPLVVTIDSIPFNISYYFEDSLILEQHNIKEKNLGYSISFGIDDDEILYGGGVRALGMNRRGHKLELYNKAHYGYETEAPLMNYCMPLFMSSKCYGIHFDAPGKGFLDLDSQNTNTVTYKTISNRKVYQVFAGNNWEELIKNWTSISGRTPKIPLWSMGNFASRFGYHSQKEVENVVKAFERDSIPLDAVILDLYWFGKTIKGTMGNLSFYKDSFPNPVKMIRGLKEKGIKTILITEPFILTTSDMWEDAIKNNIIAKDSTGNPLTYEFYFGNTGLIDVFDENARKWFWSKYDSLIKMGVDGFWGDLGEPEVHPDEMIHAHGTASEVHNIYGHEWAKMISDNYEKFYPAQIPFILMRAGYSGSQRYGMIPWSGDVNRTWGGLRSQPEIALQMGMQGLPYMHSDLGGFAGANDDPELYVRWLQYGVFQPIFRPHAQEQVSSEAVYKDEKTKSLSKEAIELRYKLLPYNIGLMEKAEKEGIPLMRPVFFEDNRPEMKLIDSAYFWGKDFFIAPVFHPNQKTKKIVLPNSGNWFDFYTNKFYQKGASIQYELTPNNIPVFVRGESFIPMSEGLMNTDYYNPDEVVINYFPDASSHGIQRKLRLSRKENNEILINSFWNKNKCQIRVSSTESSPNALNFKIHDSRNSKVKIKVNGKKIKAKKSNHTIFISDAKFEKDKLSIELKFK